MPILTIPASHSRAAGTRAPVARLLAAVWFVLQLMIVGGLPIVDAGIAHGAVVAHWEDASDGRCPTQHSETECPVLKTVASGALASEFGRVTVVGVTEVDAVRPTEADRVQRGSWVARIRTRGPPLA